jgi:hypothetical protein
LTKAQVSLVSTRSLSIFFVNLSLSFFIFSVSDLFCFLYFVDWVCCKKLSTETSAGFEWYISR